MIRTIVYVDDNKEKLSSFKRNMKSFNVITFSNSLTAFDKIRDISYDAVVLDLYMPYLDGVNFYNKLIETDKYIGQPVFFLSNSDNEDLMLRSMDLGTQELITPNTMSWAIINKRLNNRMPHNENFCEKKIKVNFQKSKISYLGNSILATNLEMNLIDSYNKSSTKEIDDIVKKTWGENFIVSKTTLSTHLCNLNKKLKKLGYKISKKGDSLQLKHNR